MLSEALKRIIIKEGGYSDHPDDRGGATNFGITEAVARKNGYTGNMRDLPVELAVKIYMKDYVEAPAFDEVYQASPLVGEYLIDFGINSGPGTAAKMLQRALNVLTDTSLVVDGDIGTKTILTLYAFLRKRNSDGARVLLKAINGLRIGMLINLAEKDPKQKSFIYGWLLNRCQ